MKRALLILCFWMLSLAAWADVWPYPGPPWPSGAYPGGAEEGGICGGDTAQKGWYVTGPSNFAARADIPWPPDNGPGTSGDLGQVANPGQANRGWYYAIRHHIHPANLAMAWKTNSEGGNSICNILHTYCCKSTADGAFMIDSCVINAPDQAAGDQTCDLAKDGVDNGDATCEQSNIYYLENHTDTPWVTSPQGINTVPNVRYITFAPGPNECQIGSTTAATAVAILNETRNTINAFIAAAPNVERINLHVGISWWERLLRNKTACANLLESTCAPADGYGGTDCTGTFQDLAAEFPGLVYVEDAPFLATEPSHMTLSGTKRLYELYTEDELHENIWGWGELTIPDALNSIGYTVTDTAPTTPVPEAVGATTTTTATFKLSAAVTDAENDTLTCVLWAVKDADWAGKYLSADRVHNGFGACRTMNLGVACPNCGNGLSDADCNVTGLANLDAYSTAWLTPTDAPTPQPDGAAFPNTFPDLYSVPCDASGNVTMKGFAANTTYRLYAVAWPTIVDGHTDKGVLPSVINDTITFTTQP